LGLSVSCGFYPVVGQTPLQQVYCATNTRECATNSESGNALADVSIVVSTRDIVGVIVGLVIGVIGITGFSIAHSAVSLVVKDIYVPLLVNREDFRAVVLGSTLEDGGKRDAVLPSFLEFVRHGLTDCRRAITECPEKPTYVADAAVALTGVELDSAILGGIDLERDGWNDRFPISETSSPVMLR